jgi:hypothetical protein
MGPFPERSFFEVEVQRDPLWLMQPGERFAIEGLLSQLRPSLSVEVGTYDGGSLRRIAAHSGAVHAFDIDERAREHADRLDNVTLHLGDSAQMLPRVLEGVAAAGGHVDFALVDGLHSYDAVTSDASILLASPACERTVIVFHDSAHAEVRRALDDLQLRHHPKVALSLLDFVPGYLVRSAPEIDEEIRGRGFNGLALVVLDAGRRGRPAGDEFFVAVPELHRAAAESAPRPSGLLDRWRRRRA